MRQQELFGNYDQVLADLCALVLARQKENSKFFGMVGAAVIDNGIVLMNTSCKKNNKWIHAERNAINSFKLRHGKISKDAIVVTTLSPCNLHNDKTAMQRFGDSCEDFITEEGIKTVYCGYQDPTQDSSNVVFDLIETQNQQVKELCKLLASTFLPI